MMIKVAIIGLIGIIVDVGQNTFLSLTDLHDPIACSILGGGIPSQNSGYESTRICPLVYLCASFPILKIWLWSPPLRDAPDFLSYQGTLTAHTPSLPLLLHIRTFVFYSAAHPQQRRLSPVVRPSEVYNLPTDFRPMPCCPWLNVQSPSV